MCLRLCKQKVLPGAAAAGGGGEGGNWELVPKGGGGDGGLKLVAAPGDCPVLCRALPPTCVWHAALDSWCTARVVRSWICC